MELFDAHPTRGSMEKIARDPMNKWLDEDEIRRMEAHDARPVSPTIGVLLALANLVNSHG